MFLLILNQKFYLKNICYYYFKKKKMYDLIMLLRNFLIFIFDKYIMFYII